MSVIENIEAIFVLEVMGVLAVPGPTNSLLFVSGVTRGLRASLNLIVAEVVAYLISISFLILVIEPGAKVHSTVGQLLRILCSIYLAQMALWLWRWEEQKQASHPISFRRVFFTTLINPKNLVFAFLIFPPARAQQMLAYFANFSAICTVVACGWITAGALLHSTAVDRTHLNWFYRGEAFVLGSFALAILISAYYYS